MLDHIEKVKKYIKEKYNKEILTLKAEKSFDYYMFEHEKTRGKNKGKKGYGWATMFCRWCTSNLKNRVIDNHLKKYKEEGLNATEIQTTVSVKMRKIGKF